MPTASYLRHLDLSLPEGFLGMSECLYTRQAESAGEGVICTLRSNPQIMKNKSCWINTPASAPLRGTRLNCVMHNLSEGPAWDYALVSHHDDPPINAPTVGFPPFPNKLLTPKSLP